MRHRTCVGRPQQNGVAERMNRTLIEKARCMLSHAELSREFWAEAVHMAAHLVNRSPNKSIELKTPEELWSGTLADYSNLRIFGCPAYAYVNHGKLEPRAKKCIFLGYTFGVKGYRLWDPSVSKFLTNRDVTFNESVFLHQKDPSTEKLPKQVENEKSKCNSDKVEVEFDLDADANQPCSEESLSTTPEVVEPEQQVQNDSITSGRARRNIKPPLRYGFEELASYALAIAETVDVQEPLSFSEAMANKDSAKWHAAMEEEMQSLLKNQKWELVRPPFGKKIVDCKSSLQVQGRNSRC